LWLKDPKKIEPALHEDFYHFITSSYDRPRFILHFNTDVPINIHCLLYFPEGKPGLFDMSREAQIGVTLYCRKVMIKKQGRCSYSTMASIYERCY